MRAAVLVLGIVLALARVAGAAPTASAPIDDRAAVLAPDAKSRIETELATLAREGLDMAVIIVRRTGTSIETFAREAAQRWTSDKAELSRAALLVLAIDDRKSRIEVNDALRPLLPDPRTQAILDNVRGYLRTGDYAGAVHAVVVDVGKAARGEAPDLESPHPQSLPATTQPTSRPSSSVPPPREPSWQRERDSGSIWLVIVAGVIVLGIGAAWAAASRKGKATLSHGGAVAAAQRSFVLDWLWCTAKVIGWVGFVLFIIAAAAASSSSSSNSSSWGGSSGGGSSGGGGWSGGSSGGGSSGGGWSGGGASSSW